MNRDEFLAAALRNPNNKIIAEELLRLALPDAWIVSGCLVQTVWNVLTGRAVDYGINDYDVFYFDPDPSWEAEDKIIRVLTVDTVEEKRLPAPPARPTADPSPLMRLVMKEGPRLVNRGSGGSGLR